MLVAEKSYYEAYNQPEIRRKVKINNDKNKKISKTISIIATFFLISFIIVFRYTAIAEMTGTINLQNKELSGLEKQVSQLKTETLIDLNTVDNIAKIKLGMDRPYSYQVTYVNLNQNNQIAQNTDNSQSGLSIVKKLSKVVEFLY